LVRLGQTLRPSRRRKRAEALGRPIAGQALQDAFAGFKRRADEIGEINDAELLALINAAEADLDVARV
jgi:2-isopropylmalate synthase